MRSNLNTKELQQMFILINEDIERNIKKMNRSNSSDIKELISNLIDERNKIIAEAGRM